MKKNYLFLAAATTLFAACVQNDLVSEIPEAAPQAISFETFANKQTRAAENSGAGVSMTLDSHHESFNVWASKYVADNDPESTSGFKYVEVYKNDDPGTVKYANSTWTASPLKYWDKTATMYLFYAAAPSSSSWHYANSEANDGSSGYLTFNDFILKGTANDNLASVKSNTTLEKDSWKKLTDAEDIDLMIAEMNIWNYGYYQAQPSCVILNFYHILSRLNINVKATTTPKNVNGVPTYSPDIKLTALDVVGLKNKGSFTEMNITTTTDPTTLATTTTIEEFENLSSGTHLRWQGVESVSISPTSNVPYTLAAHLGTGTNGLQLTSTAQATHKYLIIPQLVENKSDKANVASAPGDGEAYIQIKYTVDEESFEAYYSLAKAFGVAKNSKLAFNEGWQNTLNITISPETITFTGSVAEWANQENMTDNTTGESQDDLTIQ